MTRQALQSQKNGGVGTIEEYLAALKASPNFGPQVAHHEVLPGCAASFAEPEHPWPEPLRAALAHIGVGPLYRHQAQAVDAIRRGRHVVVATPTASGKSLIYNLPVFERILAAPTSRALYLFPLKALAQDQLRAIGELGQGLPEGLRPTAAICDGDTTSYQRKKLRDRPPNILISNPDMLHLSMLAYHDRWAGLWSGLTHVVVDEVHTYRGVFGSHMAWVLRRLRRICRLYGSEPVFVLSSATVGNPGGLARDLLDLAVEEITTSGAPRSGRDFLFLNPDHGAGFAASQLLEAAMKRGLRTIVYTQSRKMTELVAVWTKNRLGGLADKLTAYRSGFLPEERREIEAKMAGGELLGIVSTSALELGIDIGALDICILLGYPGTIMATWQRSGRVGRRQRDALIIMIAQEDALDQYFLRNPRDFFDRGVEAAVLNPDNGVIVRRHLLCACAEAVLPVDDPLLAGEAARLALAEMAAAGELQLSGDGRFWYTGRRYPHREVSLRGTGQSLLIRADDREETLLGEIDAGRSHSECHPGAVYLHRGRNWLVTSLDPEGGRVTVTAKKLHYFTRPLANKETEILKIARTVDYGTFRASFGDLRVTDRVTGFQKRLLKGHQLIDTVKLDLPPRIFETQGLWIEIPPHLQRRFEAEQRHFMGGIHALEHAAIGVFPLQILCDRNDIGGIAYPFHPQVNGPAVFIYDGYPGGVGLCRQAFAGLDLLLAAALRSVASCPCETGCPSCVHSPKCGSGNRPIDKDAARRLLHGLLDNLGQEAVVRVVAAAAVVAPSALPAAGRCGALPSGYGVFDLETKRSAAEVGGWHRAERMGISVGVVYDNGTDSFHVYREDEIDKLVAHLARLELVVGFNNSRFDYKVLSAYTDRDLTRLPTLDILVEVRNRLGYRLSLDHLAQHTLGVAKSADGLMALEWYREGRIDKIIDYCRKDVEITRDILRYGVANGYLLFRNKAGQLVRCPVRFGGGRG
ncbi:MAG: DEAD/DEAH box helicase [Desulfobulbaceae bacterium]|nr:DEAD/DEAH box helicase [Desulfobulbaceae bacterium]